MSEITPTADLYDKHGEALASCDTQFHQYGSRARFEGSIVTVRCHEDNALLKGIVSEPGEGKVVVVDGDGSVHCAMLGDKMAELALSNGWEGLVINGAIRDAAAPGHVDTVRRHVLDPLTLEQLEQLRSIGDALLTRLDPGRQMTALYDPGSSRRSE